MRSIRFFVLSALLSIVAIGLSAQTAYEGELVSAKGAWCWFADPRAIHHENEAGTINSSYIGYIDVHGNLKAMQQDFITGKQREVLIRSYFQPDDHDNPTFLVLPDDRVMIFYSRHTDEACFYYRVSKKPGDITTLGDEIRLATSHNTTYPSPFIMADDPNHIYMAWRGINWHPTIARMTMPDANDIVQFNWGPYQIVQSTAARPYAKYTSNGKDKIYMTYTTGHPDNESTNYVYFNYIDIADRKLKDIKGKVLSTVGSGVHNISATTTYKNANPDAVVENTAYRNWVWQTVVDSTGVPVVAMVRISGDKTQHNYYYAKWDGAEWKKTHLGFGGGKFHQTNGLELCYSGGMAIDDSNPDVVYTSEPVNGTYGSVYEIMKYNMNADGTVAGKEAVTTNSRLNNSRPYVLQNSGDSPLKLAWMNGNYYDWIVSSSRPLGYPTAIHANYTQEAEAVELSRELLVKESFLTEATGTASTSSGVLVSTPNTYATLPVTATGDFSITLSPYLYHGAYGGKLFELGELSYGVDAQTLKPWLKIGETTWNSTNLLGSSDVWQTTNRGTGGQWYTPTKLKFFNLTLTYEEGVLRVYRNGLIDQTVDVNLAVANELKIGGFSGWVEECAIYDRALNQSEVKSIAKDTEAYTLNSSLLAELEMDLLQVPAQITTDVLLPSKTLSGVAVSWSSSNTAVVSTTGLVTFPSAPTTVTLTATASGQTKSFQVEVLPRDITQNKVLLYRFNASDLYTAGSERYVRDLSGQGNDARIKGNAVIDGVLNLAANTAAGFSSNGHALAPDGILSGLRSCSFLLKVKPNALTKAPRLFDFGSASSNSIFLRGAAFTAGYKYNGGSTTLINASTSLPVGQESLVAMTFDARTRTTKVYLNGQQVASSTAIAYEPYQLTLIAPDNRNYIGRTQWWDTSVSGDNIDFQGTIDDFMLYDIVLTPEEIVQVQEDATAVSTLEAASINVYPNPVSVDRQLFVDGLAADTSLEMFNAQGQCVAQYDDIQSPLQLTQMNSGLYFLRFSNSRETTGMRLLLE